MTRNSRERRAADSRGRSSIRRQDSTFSRADSRGSRHERGGREDNRGARRAVRSTSAQRRVREHGGHEDDGGGGLIDVTAIGYRVRRYDQRVSCSGPGRVVRCPQQQHGCLDSPLRTASLLAAETTPPKRAASWSTFMVSSAGDDEGG
jgi:hypothetical protein